MTPSVALCVAAEKPISTTSAARSHPVRRLAMQHQEIKRQHAEPGEKCR